MGRSEGARLAFSAAELARRLGGELEGADAEVSRIAAPGPDSEGAVAVVFDADKAAEVAQFRPALLVGPAGTARPPSTPALIRVPDPRLALAQLTRLFDDRPLQAEGIDPSASIAPDAKLAEGVRVGPAATIGAGATLGRGTTVGAGAIVGDGATVGSDCRLHPRAVISDGVKIGDRVIVHSGAVLGSDGFGYAPSPTGAAKIHHLGTVVVADDVEIGANSCVDRGTLADTVIGPRTKIDNLCQIGHNVRIGSDCLIAGLCGIAGSTVIGNRVVMGGGVIVIDHASVGDGAMLGMRAVVLKSVPAGESWLGHPAQPRRSYIRQSYLVGRLERIWRFVKDRDGGEGR